MWVKSSVTLRSLVPDLMPLQRHSLAQVAGVAGLGDASREYAVGKPEDFDLVKEFDSAARWAGISPAIWFGWRPGTARRWTWAGVVSLSSPNVAKSGTTIGPGRHASHPSRAPRQQPARVVSRTNARGTATAGWVTVLAKESMAAPR